MDRQQLPALGASPEEGFRATEIRLPQRSQRHEARNREGARA